MDIEPIVALGQIIGHEMRIKKDRIFIFNNERSLPKDDGLYIVLSNISMRPYGIKSEFKNVNTNFIQVTSMNVAEEIMVSVCSKDTSARKRAYEVPLSMSSYFSQNMQQMQGFHIGQISNVVNNSDLEGTSRLNRFDCTIKLLTAYEKKPDVDYYDKFSHTEIFEG